MACFVSAVYTLHAAGNAQLTRVFELTTREGSRAKTATQVSQVDITCLACDYIKPATRTQAARSPLYDAEQPRSPASVKVFVLDAVNNKVVKVEVAGTLHKLCN